MIAPPRPGSVIVGALGTALISGLWIVVPISDQGGFASFPGYMLAVALAATALVGGATARIEVDGDVLVLVDWMTVRKVDRAAISEVRSRNGLLIVARDGGVYESVAYGRSVIQILWPSRRYARAAGRIRAWVDDGVTQEVPRGQAGAETPSAKEGRHRRAKQSRAPRKLLTRGLPLAVAVTQVLGVVLWRLSPALSSMIISG